MQELRTDELEIGMVVKLKSRCGTLYHNDFHAITNLQPLPRKEIDVFIDSTPPTNRLFAARTKWIVK